MSQLTFRIDGAKETEQRLLALANDYGPRQAFNTLRLAMRRAIDPWADQIRSATPVDSGELADSVRRVTVRPNNRNRGFGQHIMADTVISGQAGWFWRPDKQNSVGRAALATEFGNQRSPANPVLRPVLARDGQDAANRFIQEMDRAIQARIKSLNKQIAKGTFVRR